MDLIIGSCSFYSFNIIVRCKGNMHSEIKEYELKYKVVFILYIKTEIAWGNQLLSLTIVESLFFQ